MGALEAPDFRPGSSHDQRATIAAGEQDEPPAVLVEWTEALQAYVAADEAGLLTAAIRERARRAWAPLRDNPAFRPLRLMNEIERRLQ